jgi:hypothetical protein
MLLVLTTAALAQQWSYGYYSDKNCKASVAGITVDNKKGKEATGLAIGQCVTSKIGSTEWSMKLQSCSADSDGRFTNVIEVRPALTTTILNAETAIASVAIAPSLTRATLPLLPSRNRSMPKVTAKEPEARGRT